MSELITLSKNSPEFESYLLGTFSSDKRALPIQTLNVNSAAETVTFKVISTKAIQRPKSFVVWFKALKIRSFLLVLMPLFLTLTKNIEDGTWHDPISTLWATFGVLLAYAAVNLRNDFMDHMKGVDRVLEKGGSRAIQNGWVTAVQFKNYSTVMLVLSVVCALPIVWTYPAVGAIIFAGLMVGIWAQFTKQNSFKYQIGGELALFVMLGPLLTVGYQLAMGAPFDWEVFWLGFVWGWLVLFVVHLRNFVNIFPSVQAGFSNTINWMGFDKGRRLLAGWWGVFILFNLIYHWMFAGYYWGMYLAVGLAMLSVCFVLRLKSLSSPAGSELHAVFRQGFQLFLLTIALWVFECLWYLLD